MDLQLDPSERTTMSDENSNERDHVVEATDEPEVEGHAHVKAHIKNVES